MKKNAPQLWMVRMYELEIKQIMTTNREGYPTPSYLDNALWIIKEAVDGLQEFVDVGLNPFENSGLRFKNDVFEVEAYAWDESYDQSYNFKFRDIEVSWYKYLGRGMRVNRDVSALECAEMTAKCVKSLGKSRHGNVRGKPLDSSRPPDNQTIIVDDKQGDLNNLNGKSS